MTKWELLQESKVGLTSKNKLILYIILIELKKLLKPLPRNRLEQEIKNNQGTSLVVQ